MARYQSPVLIARSLKKQNVTSPTTDPNASSRRSIGWDLRFRSVKLFCFVFFNKRSRVEGLGEDGVLMWNEKAVHSITWRWKRTLQIQTFCQIGRGTMDRQMFQMPEPRRWTEGGCLPVTQRQNTDKYCFFTTLQRMPSMETKHFKSTQWRHFLSYSCRRCFHIVPYQQQSLF